MKHFHLLALSLALTLFAGCDQDEKSSPDASPAKVPQVKAEPAAAEQPAFAPEYTIEVKKNDAGKMIVVWTAKVNTGGYKLITDSVLVETPLSKLQARIYSTLEAPGPDEMVTQGITTVTAEYDAGDKNVEEAELSVRQTVRGVKSEWRPLYSVVKYFPAR